MSTPPETRLIIRSSGHVKKMLRCKPESSEKLVQEFLGTVPMVRSKIMRNWAVIGGIAAALAAGMYVVWGPVTERKKRKRGMVPGLLNLGNTCFLNSLLQGLAACPSFVTWLETFSSASEDRPCKNKQLSRTLLRILKALSTDDLGVEDVIDAGCLLEVIRLYRWHISSCEEQDAHELFHVLTSSLDEERDRQPKVTHLFDMQSLESLPEEDEKTMICRSRAPVHPIPSSWKVQHPFHGRLTSNMSCKRCEQQSPVRYDSFESLSLSIPPPQWVRPISLDQCLQHFISSETIKEVECENCTKLQQGTTIKEQALESQRTTFIKHLKLGKLPQCLCIHLQRLTWSSEGAPIKRQEHVQFTEYLSLDRYKHSITIQRIQHVQCSTQPADAINKPTINSIDAEHNNNKKILSNGTMFLPSPAMRPQLSFAYNYSSDYLFQLMAVVVHHGDMHSGHFVTYRRSPSSPQCSSPLSSQWLWVSDDSVRTASLQEAQSSNAYLLFYERVPGLGRRHQPEE